jgi:hypothetical protein
MVLPCSCGRDVSSSSSAYLPKPDAKIGTRACWGGRRRSTQHSSIPCTYRQVCVIGSCLMYAQTAIEPESHRFPQRQAGRETHVGADLCHLPDTSTRIGRCRREGVLGPSTPSLPELTDCR